MSHWCERAPFIATNRGCCCCLVAKLSLILATPWTGACQSPLSRGLFQARILERVAIYFFLTQGSNPGLLHWQHSLPLSHQGSPANSGMHIRESYVMYLIKIRNCTMILQNNIFPSSTGNSNSSL